MYVYTTYDKVSKKYLGLTIAENDEAFIRQSLFSILMDYPLADIEFYCVGTFSETDGKLKPRRKMARVLPSKYVFPKTRMGDKSNPLPLEELDKVAKDYKSKVVAESAKRFSNEKKEVANE